MDIVALIRRLSEAHGVSGYEDEIRQVVQEEFSRYADRVEVDTLGNVIAHKRGMGPEPRPTVMLAAHLDEIGLIVSYVEESFLHFEPIGGHDPRVLLGQQVLVHGRCELPGIIGARPPHVLPEDERGQTIPYTKLLVDVGLDAKELSQAVRVGDLITMHGPPIELKGNLISGKALDNRVSVAALALCLEEMVQMRHAWDVYAVATVQEEVGLKGALTSAYGLAPDIGVAVDVTWASQPGAPDEYTYELDKGVTIGCGPNFHPKLQAALWDSAKRLEMEVHLEPASHPTGTDARAIQISRHGIPTGLISIPVRNMHTPVETASIKDVQRAGRLLASFVGQLDDQFLDSLAWDLGLDEDE